MYSYEFSCSLSHTLKELLKQNISRSVPGLLEILNIYCITRYNKDFYTIFAESPCKLYKSILNLYKDENTADIVFKLLLKSIKINDINTDILLNYARNCKDKEFLETISKLVYR